jgi:aryl-alcohol dehydrogenase-like predicted oxidoreductase
LQTDHIDLYQMHRYDPTTPVDELLRALDDLVRDGKIRYIGGSNYMGWHLAELNTLAELHGWTRFVSVQNHYHMMERDIEREVLPYCKARNVGILPYFPLAGGFLTGKYQRGQAAPAGSRGESSPYVQRFMTDKNYDKVEAMEAWAKERGHTMAELAHTWLLGHPEVSSVISGATSLDQVKANAASAGWKLSEADMTEVNKILD